MFEFFELLSGSSSAENEFKQLYQFSFPKKDAIIFSTKELQSLQTS